MLVFLDFLLVIFRKTVRSLGQGGFHLVYVQSYNGISKVINIKLWLQPFKIIQMQWFKMFYKLQEH